MSPGTERDLLRLLTGQLPAEEARALNLRMEQDGELARAYERLARSWQGLSLPEPAPVPPGFATRVLARTREEVGSPALSFSAAPVAVRVLAAAAVTVGIALGAMGAHYAGLSRRGEFDRSTGWEPASLADSYWAAFDEDEANGGEAPAEPAEPEPSEETEL